MNRPEQSETVHGQSADPADSPLAQACAVASAYLEATQQAEKSQSFKVFNTLVQSAAQGARRGEATSFTAAYLRSAIAPDSAKEPSGWLSPLWSKLVEREPEWREGLRDHARRMGLAYVPKLSKVQGSPASYSLEAVALPPASSKEEVVPTPPGGVHYTPEAVAAPAAWLGGALKLGVVRWTAGVRWTIAGSVMALTLFAVVLGMLILFSGLKATRPLSLGDVLSIGTAAGLALALIPIYRFLDELFELRVVLAPSFMTPLSQSNVTLELRQASADDDAALVFVRYSSICPTCGSAVAIDDGRVAFPDRLVGRCARSAREHVFSFDPQSRTGLPLRPR